MLEERIKQCRGKRKITYIHKWLQNSAIYKVIYKPIFGDYLLSGLLNITRYDLVKTAIYKDTEGERIEKNYSDNATFNGGFWYFIYQLAILTRTLLKLSMTDYTVIGSYIGLRLKPWRIVREKANIA